MNATLTNLIGVYDGDFFWHGGNSQNEFSDGDSHCNDAACLRITEAMLMEAADECGREDRDEILKFALSTELTRQYKGRYQLCFTVENPRKVGEIVE